MGGRGSGGGKNGGGAAKNSSIMKNNEKIKNLVDVYNSVSQNTLLSDEERTKTMKTVENKIQETVFKNFKKADKIKYINNYGGADIDVSDSYTSKDINKMFNAVRKGKKMKKVGYEWVVDYDS